MIDMKALFSFEFFLVLGNVAFLYLIIKKQNFSFFLVWNFFVCPSKLYVNMSILYFFLQDKYIYIYIY
jgi:hypothetical protein